MAVRSNREHTAHLQGSKNIFLKAVHTQSLDFIFKVAKHPCYRSAKVPKRKTSNRTLSKGLWEVLA
jgi:hypothetical protein